MYEGYLKDGAYRTESQMRMIDKEVAGPNRGYVYAYKNYLELNNRKEKTLARRMADMRFF